MERRALLEHVLHRREARDRARGERPNRPGRDRVDANRLLAEIPGEVPHRRVERRLRDAHHVVVRHGPHATEVRHRHDRPAPARLHERLCASRAGDEGVGADVDGQPEPVARRIDEPALEILRRRERDGVDEDVEAAAECLGRLGEHALEVGVRADVAGGDELGSTVAARSRTAFSMRSPWYVNASSRPPRRAARRSPTRSSACSRRRAPALACPRTCPAIENDPTSAGTVADAGVRPRRVHLPPAGGPSVPAREVPRSSARRRSASRASRCRTRRRGLGADAANAPRGLGRPRSRRPAGAARGARAGPAVVARARRAVPRARPARRSRPRTPRSKTASR